MLLQGAMSIHLFDTVVIVNDKSHQLLLDRLGNYLLYQLILEELDISSCYYAFIVPVVSYVAAGHGNRVAGHTYFTT